MIRKLTIGLYIIGTLMILSTLWRIAEWKYGVGFENTTDAASISSLKTYSAGWNQIGDSWCYFGNDGHKMTGWIKDGGKFYYLKEDGNISVGRVEINGSTYNFGQDGALICDSITDEDTLPSSTTPTREKYKSVSNYSWFDENGNTYFKKEDTMISGQVNIDGDLYYFDKKGVMQKNVIYNTPYGKQMLYGNDGKLIKVSENNMIMKVCAAEAITTKSSTNNSKVKLDDSHLVYINEVDSEGKIVNQKGIIAKKDKSIAKVIVEGNTFYCQPKQTIELGAIKVSGTDEDSTLLPKLIISAKSSDESVAYSGINLILKDGVLSEIHPEILVYKPGKTTITIDVNGTQTSFEIVVNE